MLRSPWRHCLASPSRTTSFGTPFPLIVAISLVYGATRDEAIEPILFHAYRSAVMICTFLSIMFAVLWVVSLFV